MSSNVTTDTTAFTWREPLIGLLALLLLLPVVGTGWAADDYLHQVMLNATPGLEVLERHPLDLFRFAAGDAGAVHALMARGVFPWWADPEVRIAFFRPLASATHYLDFRLWPASPVAMHVHSLAWFGALLGIVATLYRELGNARTPSLLAFTLFAVDDTHAPVVGWIANRNALMAATFSLCAVLCLHRSRSVESARALWLGPAFFALALLAGETALCGAAYLFAYALHLDRRTVRERIATLAPYAVVLIAWKVSCVFLGYGVSGSGVYVDPLQDAAAFAEQGVQRFLVLALALVAAPFSELWELYPLVLPQAQPVLLCSAGLIVVLLAAVFSESWRAEPVLRFFCTGALLALIPACATFPHDRLLLVPSFGAMGAIAALLLRAWQRRAQTKWAVFGGALALLHLGAAPLLTPLRAASVAGIAELVRESNATLPRSATGQDTTLVLLNPALDPLASYLPIQRAVSNLPEPARLLWLAPGTRDVELRTLDERRVELRPEGGFLRFASERMLRRPGTGLTTGARVSFAGVEVLVVEQTEDGRPLRVVVDFGLELSDPRLVFMRWHDTGYVQMTLPSPGLTTTLPGANLMQLLLRLYE